MVDDSEEEESSEDEYVARDRNTRAKRVSRFSPNSTPNLTSKHRGELPWLLIPTRVLLVLKLVQVASAASRRAQIPQRPLDH